MRKRLKYFSYFIILLQHIYRMDVWVFDYDETQHKCY